MTKPVESQPPAIRMGALLQQTVSTTTDKAPKTKAKPIPVKRPIPQ